jgi:hypothetical protein
MREVNLPMLCSLGLLMTLFNLSDHASAEFSTGMQHIGRPSTGAIVIRDVKMNHINNAKGGTRYQAQMRIRNNDANWIAVEACIHVRFRDAEKKSVDTHQTACLRNLTPLDERELVVTYPGYLPPHVSELVPEARVDSIKWAPKDQ